MIRILIGDVHEKLAELPDESVHMVCTSPPYFNLRDYGTAQWEGGDAACDHGKIYIEKRQTERQAGVNGGVPGSLRDKPRTTCKCGAVRIDQQIGLEAAPTCGMHGLLRLRHDLTEDQREYVVRRLLGGERRDV